MPAAVSSLLATALVACQGVSAGTATDLERLQGYWEGYGPGGDCSVTISGNSLYFHGREDFWFQTTFTLPPDTDPKQLHATITEDSSPQQSDVGTVVVAIFKIEDGTLTLGVVEDFEGPPEKDVAGDWDRVMDVYHLERARAAGPAGPTPASAHLTRGWARL